MYITDQPKIRHMVRFETSIRRTMDIEVDLPADATDAQINEAINQAQREGEWLTTELEKPHWVKAEHYELSADGVAGGLLAFEGRV